MPKLENVVAVDWRSGDRCYFFFKDNNTPDLISEPTTYRGYPAKSTPAIGEVSHSRKNLRFGFTTTGSLTARQTVLTMTFYGSSMTTTARPWSVSTIRIWTKSGALNPLPKRYGRRYCRTFTASSPEPGGLDPGIA
jgi:hypothetical protein